MRDLAGKVAVVTGAGSGVGRALCLELARQGMDLAVSDIDPGGAEAVAGEVRAIGRRAMAFRTDVADPASVDELAEQVCASLGTPALLCNNAGVLVTRPASALTGQDWDWTLDVNLHGVVLGTLAFLPRMRAGGAPGHIVNTASIAGLIPDAVPGIVAYTTSKHGVVGWSQALREGLRGSPLGVSVICPGTVATRIAAAGRNRQPRYGGVPTAAPGEVPSAGAPVPGVMAPDTLARLVAAAVRRDQFCILSHPEYQQPLAARFKELQDALAGGGAPSPRSPLRVHGCHALVTRAGEGVGRALSLALGAAGARVLVADRDLGKAESVAAGIRAGGGRALAQAADPADRASLTALASAATAAFGPVEILCVGTGAPEAVPLEALRLAHWRRAVPDLMGAVNAVTAFLPGLLAAGHRAQILHCGSLESLAADPRFACAAAARHALTGLTEALRRELAGTAVGVSMLIGEPESAGPAGEHGAGLDAQALLEGIRDDRPWIGRPDRAALDAIQARLLALNADFQRSIELLQGAEVSGQA